MTGIGPTFFPSCELGVRIFFNELLMLCIKVPGTQMAQIIKG